MRVLLCSLLWGIAVLVQRGLANEDALSLVQQSLTVASSADGPEGSYSIGETVQVKFRGEKSWADCTIRALGSMPDTYTVHAMRVVDGQTTEKTHKDVPVANLRRVFRGFQVSIDQGDGDPIWVACNVISLEGGFYTVQLLDLKPGLEIDHIKANMIRDGPERAAKAQRTVEMIKESEARKSSVVTAKLKPSTVQAQEDHRLQIYNKEQTQANNEAMKQYVWREMARRAKEEEEKRQEKLAKHAHRKKSQVEEQLKKAREEEWALQEQRAASDPAAALMVQAHRLAEETAAQEKALRTKQVDTVEEVFKTRQMKKKIEADKAKAVEQKQARIKKEHEAFLKARRTAQASPEQQAVQARATKVLQASEEERKEKAKLFEDAFGKQSKDKDEEEKPQDESHRRESAKLRKKGIAINRLKQAKRAFENEDPDISLPDHWGLLHNMATAANEATDAGVEAEEVDPVRVIATKAMTTYARQRLKRSIDSGALEDAQTTLKRLSEVAKEIERVWNNIKDPDSKWHTEHFQVSELDDLQSQMPQLQRREVKMAALRSAIDLARVDPNLMEKAIQAAEGGGLPGKEIDEAHAQLKKLKVKPSLIKAIAKARKARDVDRMAEAIANAEASGLFSSEYLNSARHSLHAVARTNEMKGDKGIRADHEDAEEARRDKEEEARPRTKDLASLAP